MTHKEIHQQLPDYVLGLLAPNQADQMSDHLASCAACRRTVQGEREIGALVRETVHLTTMPDAARLRRLMPPVPQRSGRDKIFNNWTGRLAPALVLLLILFGSWFLNTPDSERQMSFFMPSTATATATNTPTATIVLESGTLGAQTSDVSQTNTSATSPPLKGAPAPVFKAPTPPIAPTPVAANSQMAAN